MKLGVIVIPDSNEELPAVLKALKGINVEAAGVSDAAPDSMDDLDGLDDLGVEELPQRSLEDVKKILTQVRDAKGNDQLKEILTAFGATNLKTLGAEDYSACYASAEEMLKEDDDDMFGDLDDGGAAAVPDADTIKALCQAYAKKHGKEKAAAVLKKAGLNTVRGLAKATVEQLESIYKIVKVME